MKTLSLTFILLTSALFGQLPQFTVIDTLEEGAYGAAAWGDCDNDGDMDLCYISQILPDAATLVYINNNNVFTQTQQGFPLLYNPAVRWVDLNNDNFDDLVIGGMDSVLNAKTFVYQSNGNGTFTLAQANLIGLSTGFIDAADYNNDGWQDIAITGTDSLGQTHAYIYKNLQNFTFEDINAGVDGIYFGELKWGDYNNDNLVDLVIAGRDVDASTKLYTNMGNNVFQLNPTGFTGAAGTVDWYDYNKDGWLDILLTGTDSTFAENVTLLYQNNQNGGFSLVNTNLIPFGEPSEADIADINNDGNIDILLMGGNTDFFNLSAVALSNGSSQFNNVGFFNGSINNPNVEAADIDNDGDIDLLWGFYILRNDFPVMGIEEHSHQQFTIYPQPATNVLCIKADKAIQSVSLLTSSGQRVLFQTINNAVTEINTSTLSAGLYIAQLNINGQLYYKKVLLD